MSSYALQMSGELKSGVWMGNWVNSVGGLRGWRMGVLPSFQNTKQVVFSGAGWLGESWGGEEWIQSRLVSGRVRPVREAWADCLRGESDRWTSLHATQGNPGTPKGGWEKLWQWIRKCFSQVPRPWVRGCIKMGVQPSRGPLKETREQSVSN